MFAMEKSPGQGADDSFGGGQVDGHGRSDYNRYTSFTGIESDDRFHAQEVTDGRPEGG